ncbi:hypothetical protein E4T66_19760 [Sinimarinibacterium sp. CAU 1509]|uniref:hypothetical protein n=1 Tax=Sinimarinibacterium sp. CAU 1509 TaxID=2562283 RepID=UPI0010AD3C4B|nr:hypothetical protein [Sinimarinibacterium sp. CAU 1509]TJY56202.1 hypothetical protein E4T66_19760 [Sinimarinibacterium sp. CAU 1509]
MPSSDHLPADLAEALRRGRAIPLLLDYRLPEACDYTLSVIGTIDDAHFHGLFLPDTYAGEKLVRMNVPGCPESPIVELKTDSADANAIHELWSRWHGGVLEGYLQFMRAIAYVLSMDKLQAALETAEVLDPVADTPEPKAPDRKSQSKGRKKRSAPPTTKKGGRQRS